MRISKLFLVLLSTIISYYGQAQGKKEDGSSRVTGKVIDSASGKALEYATVSLEQRQTKKIVNGATSDNKGGFAITEVAEGEYSILIESIGYEPYSIATVSVQKEHPMVDLKTIALQKKQVTMQTVTVTSRSSIIDNKIDKLVYNAEKDITSQTGVATDVLKKVPQVSVDADGNVELAGSSGIRFLINGKPSAAFGSNIADVLQSIPASQIKSIEVVTSPGAKYDAQGMGGIINIILKKSTVQGVNGNLSLSAGTRMDNGSFNFNARKGNFGINAFVSGNLRPAVNTPSVSDRTTKDTASQTIGLLHQDAFSHFKRSGFQTGLGFDWTYKEKNSFSGSLSYNRFGNEGSGSVNQFLQMNRMDNGAEVSNTPSQTFATSTFDYHGVDASLNYKRTFNKEDKELEIGINTSSGNNLNTSDNYQLHVPNGDRFYGNKNSNPGTSKETEVNVDFTQPFSNKMVLGVGSKFSTMNIISNSNVLSFNPADQSYSSDPSSSNSLKYDQKVYALYSELNMPVKELFNVKFGGRYERTEISSFFSNAQHQTPPSGYNTFVPSLYFSKKIDEKQFVKLGYSKRIERPDYNELNPYVNTTDPKNLSTGNPYLQPEIGHRFELSYTYQLGKTGSLMATLFYRYNVGDIQPFIRYYPTYNVGDSVYTNVSVSRRENIGTEKNTGINLFADLHFGTKLSVRSNVFLFQRYIINTQDPGYNSSGFLYRVNANATYQFSSTLVAEFFGNFNSVRHQAQGIYPSFTTYSFALRKQFWKKNGSLALTAANPFSNSLNQTTNVFGPNFSLISTRQIPFRSFGINFTWKFGKLEFKKAKENNDTNMAPEG